MIEVARIETARFQGPQADSQAEAMRLLRELVERYPTVEALRRDLASCYRNEEQRPRDAECSWIVVLDGIVGLCGFLGNLRRSGEAAHAESLSPSITATLRLAVRERKTEVHSSHAAETFRREGDSWAIAYDGRAFHLKDAKGLQYIGQLLRYPHREFHALELAAVAEKRTEVPGAPHFLDGDAGPMLDGRAKREYRSRLSDLEYELDQAEALNDIGLANRIWSEIEFLAGELTRSIGLGGRDRRAASSMEKARQNVSRAVKAAIEKISIQSRALGNHLRATVRTGIFCSYTPDPRLPIDWQV